MRQLTRVFFIALLTLLWIAPAAYSGETILPPYTVSGMFLSDQIIGDTLANGARRDPECVYILVRGGLYLSNAVIRNNGWPLTIRAQDSTGNRPVILLADDPVTGRPPGQFINLAADVYIKNLIISGYDERTPDELGGLQGALFDMAQAGNDLVIDSCLLTNTNGNHVRTAQAPRLVKITNCIFANMGYLGRSNLGAGKAIDVRGGSVDSLIVRNNTFVNWQDRIIRHFSSTANIQYLEFDHNTLVNGMSYHGLLSLGRVGYRAIITNNLMVDAFALGADTDGTRQAEFTDSGELDQFNFPRMTWVISAPNDSTVWEIRNNYYAISDSGQAFYDQASTLPIVANPPLTKGSPLTWHINSKLGADSATAFQEVDVTLGNVPKLMTEMMRWYRLPSTMGGAGKTKQTGNFAAQYDYDRRGYRYFRDTLDCTYPTSSPLYTAADGGLPVGDLNWFGITVDVPLDNNGVPVAFALSQNWPNPFNPVTQINYTIGQGKDWGTGGLGEGGRNVYVQLSVYDLLGRQVAVLVNEQKAPGSYTVRFDGAGLASGMYLYRLQAGGFTEVKKMMLVK